MKQNIQSHPVRAYLTLAAALALIFTLLWNTVSFAAACDTVRGRVLRLHVLANSDSEADQALKLLVRDRVVELAGEYFADAANLEESEAIAAGNLEAFAAAARQVILEQGYDYPVTVRLCNADFNTRTYGKVTLPAGEYRALEILIGSGQGQNWWCVLFPALCLPASSAEDLSQVTQGESLEITSEGTRYQIRFKLVEWYEKWRSKKESAK